MIAARFPLVLSVLFLACGKEGAPAGTDADTDADADADADADIEVPADNVTNALGDCYGYYQAPEEYPNQLYPGEELERYTLEDPEAVCNDGTRAVMYVRAYSDPAFQDVWSIHLQGGGGCSSYLSCAIRWCGLDYFDSSKMSSANLPLRIAGFGIFDADSDNLLAGANQVYFYYCSSDAWRGEGSSAYDADDVELPEEADVEIPFDLPNYTTFRRGHTIVASGLAELSDGLTSDGGSTELPALADAQVVVFNGTSAGSVGARANADFVRDQLAPNGTQVYAIFDAANTPPGEFGSDTYASELAEVQILSYEQSLQTEDTPLYMDQTCLDAHGGSADEPLCYDAAHVMFHHITTPFFVRQDLRDITGAAEATSMTEDEHEQAVVDMLGAVADIPATGEEGADILTLPGAYGPNCGQHVALEMSDWWYGGTVQDAVNTGVEWTFQDAVVAWYTGTTVAVIDDPVAGSGDGARSTCADVDDER